MNSAGTVHGTISDGAFYYKDLYKLAKLLPDNLSSGGFIKGPKNITNWRRGIAKHILSGEFGRVLEILVLMMQVVLFICLKKKLLT